MEIWDIQGGNIQHTILNISASKRELQNASRKELIKLKGVTNKSTFMFFH